MVRSRARSRRRCRAIFAQSGFTLLLDVSNQQSSNVMWASQNPNIDITMAVVQAYNASSGVTAPPPSAPSAGARGRSAPDDAYHSASLDDKVIPNLHSPYGRPDGLP